MGRQAEGAGAKTSSPALRSTRTIEKVWIPVSGGRRLSATITLPTDANKRNRVPVVLDYSPYGKSLNHRIASHGYASVVVEVAGTGDSEGKVDDEYTRQERQDALEVLKWLGKRPWSTGKVGMMGISWQGFNSLQVAALRPPELAGIVVAHASENRYSDDAHYKGGAMLSENHLWGTHLFAQLAAPPNPAIVGKGYLDQWLERLSILEPPVLKWLSSPDESGRNYRKPWLSGTNYWETEATNPKNIKVPVYAIGGWADAYVNTVMRLVGSTSGPTKGLIGPWSHGSPDQANPGPQIDFMGEVIRFFDHVLKGEPNGVMDEPKLVAWMQESVPPGQQHVYRPGRWVAESDWPGTRTITKTSFYLGAKGRLSHLTPTANRTFKVQSPQTVGRGGGKYAGFGAPHHFPADQQDDDRRSLTFDLPPLAERTEILGAPVVTLRLRSSKSLGNVIVRLNDVMPDGRSTRVSYGVLNLSHRDGHHDPKPMVPGQEYEVHVRLNDIGHAFLPGHRIRLSISNAYWPLLWPAAEAGALQISAMGSKLDLPIRAQGEEPKFAGAPPISPPPDDVSPEEDGSHRQTFVDRRTAREVTQIGRHETYTIRPNDPNSATARASSGWQGGDGTGVQVESRLTSTKTHHQLRTRLRAYHEGRPVFDRSWNEKVPRAP